MHERAQAIAIILNYIRDGNTIKDSCLMAGISRASLYRWLRTDKSLRIELKRAEVEGVKFHLANITKASERDWKASAWWLERKYPKQFGKPRQIEVNSITRASSHEGEPTGQIDLATLEQAVSVLQELNFFTHEAVGAEN